MEEAQGLLKERTTVTSRALEPCMQGCEAREEVSQRDFWPDITIWKAEHMIRLTAAFRADLEWWHIFVGSWNGISMMLKESWQTPGVEIWSNASGSWGCGALWGTQ